MAYYSRVIPDFAQYPVLNTSDRECYYKPLSSSFQRSLEGAVARCFQHFLNMSFFPAVHNRFSVVALAVPHSRVTAEGFGIHHPGVHR